MSTNPTGNDRRADLTDEQRAKIREQVLQTAPLPNEQQLRVIRAAFRSGRRSTDKGAAA
ncbi:hypothetical protein [Enemella dayhoffiae]|uniref:hypothetical protein n=1 Tax=Enemella dayhoffiae TaxID=2016507 RepID=UPI0015956F32|nr:hypothetical protein [Enemella dayhoffiae]